MSDIDVYIDDDDLIQLGYTIDDKEDISPDDYWMNGTETITANSYYYSPINTLEPKYSTTANSGYNWIDKLGNCMISSASISYSDGVSNYTTMMDKLGHNMLKSTSASYSNNVSDYTTITNEYSNDNTLEDGSNSSISLHSANSGIYVYSFELKLKSHKPSGCWNIHDNLTISKPIYHSDSVSNYTTMMDKLCHNMLKPTTVFYSTGVPNHTLITNKYSDDNTLEDGSNSGIYVYLFALTPENFQPPGSTHINLGEAPIQLDNVIYAMPKKNWSGFIDDILQYST